MEKSARRVSEGVMIERSVPTRIATARVGWLSARSLRSARVSRFIGSPTRPRRRLLAHFLPANHV